MMITSTLTAASLPATFFPGKKRTEASFNKPGSSSSCKWPWTRCNRRSFPVAALASSGNEEVGTTAISEGLSLACKGSTLLKISRLGVGTLQWGDPGSGFSQSYGEDSLRAAFDTLIEGGINFFDSAEVYGYQGIKEGSSSEQIVGRFAKRASANAGKGIQPVVATKFFTIPWTNLLVGGGFRLGRQSLIAALKESLRRLEVDRVDLYQIHFPFPTFSNSVLMEGLREAVELGLTTAVGVSNYSLSQMEEAHDLLAKSGIPLASNQVKYSLLHRNPEREGLLRSCQERNVALIAYSPLGSGLLSQKTLARDDKRSQEVRPLLEVLKRIGAENGGKSVSQVALNYLVTKGAVPIPGCKNVQQAKEHVGVLGWQLSTTEVDELERAAASCGF